MSENLILYTDELTGEYEGFVVTQEEIKEAMQNEGFDTFEPTHTCILGEILELRSRKARNQNTISSIAKEEGNRNDPEWGEYVRLKNKFFNKAKEYSEIKADVIKNWQRAK